MTKDLTTAATLSLAIRTINDTLNTLTPATRQVFLLSNKTRFNIPY